MEWVVIFAVFAAVGYVVYHNKKDSSGGSFRDNNDNDAQR